MRTDRDLIDDLVEGLRPTPPYARLRLLGLAAAGGLALSALLLLSWLGIRPDLQSALGEGAFWLKLAFVVATAAAALALVGRLARPEGRVGAFWAVVALPLAVVAAIGGAQLAATAPELRAQAWLGGSALDCPSRIVALSAPVLLALLMLMRARLAPTRPAQAGFAVGLAAGGLGAAAYALHCPEQSAAFMASWYGLGILLSGLAGALAGTRLLRW